MIRDERLHSLANTSVLCGFMLIVFSQPPWYLIVFWATTTTIILYLLSALRHC